MIQRTCVILKPDCIQRALVGEVISRFEKKGLTLVAVKMVLLDDELLGEHYYHLKSKPFFGEIKEFMGSSPCIAMVWEGIDAVAVVRKMVGITRAREAEPGTIRGDWALSMQCNLVHASDGDETAQKEIARFFSKDEILPYRRVDFKHTHSKREREDERYGG